MNHTISPVVLERLRKALRDVAAALTWAKVEPHSSMCFARHAEGRHDCVCETYLQDARAALAKARAALGEGTP